MKGHFSTKVQTIAEPVWLVQSPALVPLFTITPKCKKKTNHIPHFIEKMKGEKMNPALIKTF